MKISTDGGSAQQVSKGFFDTLDVSPDCAHALGGIWDEGRRRVIPAILNVDTGAAVADSGPQVFRFYLSDGRIATLDRIDGKSIVRVHSADGSSVTAVTPPNDEILLFGAASRDGRIAFSRGLRHTDVVLITAK